MTTRLSFSYKAEEKLRNLYHSSSWLIAYQYNHFVKEFQIICIAFAFTFFFFNGSVEDKNKYRLFLR